MDDNYIENLSLNEIDENIINNNNNNEIYLQTSRNKWRNHNIEDNENNHELLEIVDNIKIYKYSDIKRKSPHNLIYQYYFDEFEISDEKNAIIMLFIGKTGDGKTTAINALFNIIKGIKLEDNYRFILIKEKTKEKGQAESQTDGLHLYYIKDKNNNPIILIDSQGFGDTRGKKYDESIKQAFEYTFDKLISHINIICFVARSDNPRLDKLTKYIFSFATSLFSDELSKNFVILSSFADKYTIKKGPLYINSIVNDDFFKEILDKMDKKWWYAVDSLYLFDSDIKNKLCIYTFNQYEFLYNEKIVNLDKKDIRKSLEIIKIRIQIKIKIENIIYHYKNIKNKKKEINKIEENVNEFQKNINYIDDRINMKIREINYIYIPDKDYQISSIEKERDRIINDLDNQYRYYNVRRYRYVGGDHTSCNSCKNNCHSFCYCYFSFRCTIFTFSGYCEKCGHRKESHNIHSKYKYVNETEKDKIDNSDKIQKERDRFWERYSEITKEYNIKKNIKETKEREKNDLIYEKNKFINKKYSLNMNIDILNNSINNIYNDILSLIIDLIHFENDIKNNCINKKHIEIENDYINTLIFQNEIICANDQIYELKKIKRYNEIYLYLKDISEFELNKKGGKYYVDKIENELY